MLIQHWNILNYIIHTIETYFNLTSNNTISGINTFSNYNYVNEIAEQINSVSGITTALSLSYTSCKGINYIQTPTSNFSLALTNIPTLNTNSTYTISLMILAKFYCNSITVNGSSYTMIAGNGLTNISVNSGATYVIQQINVMFLNSSTPIVVTNIVSLF